MKGYLLAMAIATTAPIACQSVPALAGQAADDPVSFEMVDEATDDGALYRSADHAGAPIVIEFYFNGCPACESNAANVKRLATAYHKVDGAQVVEASIDCDASDYTDWVDRHAPAGPVLNGCDGDLRQALGVSRYPTTVVLDAEHKVVHRSVGVWSQSTYRTIERLVSTRLTTAPRRMYSRTASLNL